jgi:protein TonB
MIDWRDPDGRSPWNGSALAVLRWSAAAVVIVAAHGAALWLALNWEPPSASAGEPPPAVMIDLAPLAVAPETPPQDIAPGPQMTEAQPDPTPDIPDKPVDRPDEKPEPVQEEVKKLAEVPLSPPVPPPPVEIPKLPEKPDAEAVLTPPPPAPQVLKKPPPKKKVERKKPIDPDKPKAPHTTAPETSPNPRADRAAAPSSSAASTPSMSPASWKGELMAHLNRYKRFPSGAAGTGTASVAFTISRSGQVLSARLIRSSGDGALDEEAVSLPRRASPVPAPPPNVGGGGAITLAVPIRFNR